MLQLTRLILRRRELCCARPPPRHPSTDPPPPPTPPPAPQNPKNRLDMHEAKDSSVYVKGLNSFVVKSEAEIAAVLEVGGGCDGRLPRR